MRACILACTALVAGVPSANLAETLGEMTAFIDGDAHSWHLITFEKGGKLTASAGFRQTPHKAEIFVYGHASPEFTSKGGLSLEVRYPGQYTADAPPMSIDVLYLPEGLRGPIWTSNDAPEPPSIEVIAFDVWGGVGRFEAVFQAQLCLREFIYSPTDTSQCLSVSGQVSTELLVE